MEQSYRFSDIYGQNSIKEHLQNAALTGRVSHAYILNGEKGSGRGRLALTFASLLQCEQPQKTGNGFEPCGSCTSCRQAAGGNHPDIIPVMHDGTGSDGKTKALGVEDIRAMRSDIRIKPYKSRWKIYIVPDADRMTLQAQNALLKTLEEPPAYAVILLLSTALRSFLPTVLSRSVVLNLLPVDDAVLAESLADRTGLPARDTLMAARLSHGNEGRAMELLTDESLIGIRQETVRFLKGLADMPSLDISEFSAAVSEDFTDIARSWFRDLLVWKSTQDPERLIFQEEVKYISNAAGQVSYADLEQIRQAFDLAQQRRKTGGNDALVMELMLLSIRDILHARNTEYTEHRI